MKSDFTAVAVKVLSPLPNWWLRQLLLRLAQKKIAAMTSAFEATRVLPAGTKEPAV